MKLSDINIGNSVYMWSRGGPLMFTVVGLPVIILGNKQNVQVAIRFHDHIVEAGSEFKIIVVDASRLHAKLPGT